MTDIGMALSMYPLSIASAFNHTWIGGDLSCLYYGLMGMIFSVASIMTLAAMGLVRYLVTGNPPKSGNVLIALGLKRDSNSIIENFKTLIALLLQYFISFSCIQAQKVNVFLLWFLLYVKKITS